MTSAAKRDAASRVTITSLPSEMVEQILSWASVSDVIAFSATCHAFYQLSLSPALWKALCRHQATSPLPDASTADSWRRAAILRHSQALYLHALGGRTGRAGPPVTLAETPRLALGFKGILPTCNNHFLWDQRGMVFTLSDSVSLSPGGQLVWSEASRSLVLCRNAKDVTVDPRSDVSHRQYVYTLVTRPPGPTSILGGRPGSTVSLKPSDSVEIYQQHSGDRVFHMTFHPSLTFSQLRLMGSEVRRTLLLLTDSGRVYTVSLNETELNRPRSFTVQLTLRVINHLLPDLEVKQIHTSYSSALFITGDGSVYVETHSAAVHRHLFGSLQGFSPNNNHTPMLLPLPYKVVRCSLGLTHLCLLDESGRAFMQGSNNHGQLGTGDKIDRREPTQNSDNPESSDVKVALSLTPVDVCCGLNHSLALLRGEMGEKEVQGCGCGRGGRLPGWTQGSPVFVRLSVKAPRSTRALCSSKYYLYLLCCHDITEPLLFHTPHPRAESAEETAERKGLQRCLSQLRGCGRFSEQLAALRETVHSHMTLSSVQKDFLEEALSTMQQSSSSTAEFQL